MSPRYFIKMSFTDSILKNDLLARKLESQAAWTKFLTEIPNSNKQSALEAKQIFNYFYSNSFLDSTSRKTLFGNSISAKLWFNIGIIKGNIAFWKSGMVFTLFGIDQKTELLNNINIENNDIGIGWLKNTENAIIIYGVLPKTFGTASFSNQVIEDIQSNQKSMYFEITFDKMPDEKTKMEINTSLNKIDGLEFLFPCDDAGANLLSVPLKLKTIMNLKQIKNII